MKDLLKYDPIYGITKDWVEKFREWLLKDISIIDVGRDYYRLQYKSYEWILTNNGLEFNLLFVNLWSHESIPYVKNKRVIDADLIVMNEIIPHIKEDYRLKKELKLINDQFTQFMLGDRLSSYDAEYIDRFLKETRTHEQ